MGSDVFQSYLVEERSYVSFIKREIHNLVAPKFGENRTAGIDIVVSELCSNLIKHAHSGELLYRLSYENEQPVFELLCIDNGQGIHDIPHSSRDGISSKSSLGSGLGAIARLSSFNQVYSLPGWGTIVYSRFTNSMAESRKPQGGVLIRTLNVAKPGELVSGDAFCWRRSERRTMILAGDGLGHGPFAKEAVDAAKITFNASNTSDASEMIRELNIGVKKTRGLVATVAILDHESKKWEICGVGNILTRMQNGIENKNYVCNNGIVGLNVPNRLENCVFQMEKFQLLIMCSDGIKTRWDLAKYPSILKYDPQVIASVIYKDHSRKTDDMSVLIAKVT